jgi:hypothetical protein
MQFKEQGKNVMEKVIVLFSVPIFLVLVLLIALFVLAKYSGNEPAKGTSTKDAPTEAKAPDTTEGADTIAT